jgi:hypothetical protein
MSHFACSTYDFNIVYTHKVKSEATFLIKQTINLIHTKFDDQMIFFRSDEKRSLDDEFKTFMFEKKIIYESSTSITFAQNEHSEKKDHLLIMKTRIMRIKISLSVYLWFWVAQSIDYLMNRIFMHKHEWKTSFEKMHDKKSHLEHFKKFECKTYSLNKHVSQKEKLVERAHFEFLIRYDSTNIFMIWIFSQRKIIRTRDVLFDENFFYKLDDESDLMKLINESMIQVELAFDFFNISSLIIQNLNSNEEKDLSIERSND